MAASQLGSMMGRLRKLVAGQGPGRPGDRVLLERFVKGRDETAFASLLAQHGPMVLDVCRRVLRDSNAAEDAFQATFLVFLRKAESIRQGELLGNWLYGVAYRTAARANVEAARRRAYEGKTPSREAAKPLAEITVRELLAVLDEELHRLPARFRAPLVMRYLEGKTRDEAARQCGWSPATLGRRLERGRNLLRARLARRGLTLPAALLSILLSRTPSAAGVPAALAAATTRLATRASAAAPARVAALAEGVLKAMFIQRIQFAALALLAGVLVALVAGGLAYRVLAGVLAKEPEMAKSPRPDEEKSKIGLPQDRPDIVTKDPEKPLALVRAAVVDQETGVPIKTFRVVPGTPYNRIKNPDDPSPAVWQPHLLREGANGVYEWPTERSYDQFRLRFEADGYIPEQSAWFQKSDGPKAITVRLKRDPGIHGRVLQPDGRPAAKATLGVAMPNRGVRIENGRFAKADDPLPAGLVERWRRPIFVQADDQGRYRLPTETGPAMVYAIHDTGIAEISYPELKQTTDIRLSAWGSIDGRVVWIDKPGANEKLSLIIVREVHGYPDSCSLFHSLTSDGQGRFRVEKLPPWRLQLSRSWELPNRPGGYLFPNVHITLAAGRPTQVVFGGAGRSVTGKLVGLDSYEGITLTLHPRAPRPGDKELWEMFSLVAKSGIGPIFHRQNLPVNEDGTFRIDNVLPESYQMFVRSKDNSVNHGQGLTVEPVPEDKPGKPLDLGEIRIKRR